MQLLLCEGFSLDSEGRVSCSVESATITLEEVRAIPASNGLTKEQADGLLIETTGQPHPIRPVVLFPEWYVNSSQASPDIWVLNPKALPAFIANTPKLLSKQQVMQATYSVSRYIKTH